MPTWRSTSVPTLRVSRPHRTAYRVVDEARRRGSGRKELWHGTRARHTDGRQGASCPGYPGDGGGPLLSRRHSDTAAVETVRMSGDRDRSTFYTPGPRFEDDVP